MRPWWTPVAMVAEIQGGADGGKFLAIETVIITACGVASLTQGCWQRWAQLALWFACIAAGVGLVGKCGA